MVLLYIAVLWYGLRERTNTGYIVIAVGLVAGLVINYFNYRINLKDRLEQKNKQ
ncbi:hypothetical protein [Lederbergia graminis]|uniref:hypothetical protein n=1 Tax=Lederbergia graminis TaxID=735518 RepID=UPI0016425C3E